MAALVGQYISGRLEMTRNNKIFAAAASIAALSMPLGGVAAQANPNATVTTPTLEPAEDSATSQPMTDTSATADTSSQTTASPGAQTTAADPAASETAAAANTAATNTGAASASGATVAATAADVTAGARVIDTQGGEVGTVESADGSNAVVATGKARVQIPIASFAKNDQGLVISLSKSQLEAQAGSPSA